MKRILAFLIACMMIFTGCAGEIESDNPISDTTQDITVSADISEAPPAETELSEEDYIDSLDLEQLGDERLLQYVEDSMYSSLEYSFPSDDYIVEDVSAAYISKEYLEEIEYNSAENIYFGYTLEEILAELGDEKFVFTLGENGETAVQALEEYDGSVGEIIKNVAIGSGVILISVTVFVASQALGAPQIVTAVFLSSAKTAGSYALFSAGLSAAASAIITGFETHDIKTALKEALISGSESFKWGAIAGAAKGAIGEIIKAVRPAKTVPTWRDSEKYALEKYPGKEQVSYLDGKEVPFGTPGATRPDIAIDVNGHLEAVEVKNYDLSNPNNVNSLCHTLKEQVVARVENLPENSTQKILLDTRNRGFSKEVIENAVNKISEALSEIYNNIPIDILR